MCLLKPAQAAGCPASDVRWGYFCELDVWCRLPVRVGRNTQQLSFHKDLNSGFNQVVPAASITIGVLSFHSHAKKPKHQGGPLLFYLFFRRVPPGTFWRENTKQDAELCSMYINSLLEYKEQLISVSEERWLTPGALQYS